MLADHELPEQAEPSKVAKRPILINPKKIIFNLLFGLLFLFSGLITMVDVIPYRMAFASLLVLPLLPIYRFKITRVVLVYGVLTLSIVLSGIINGSSVLETVLFMRVIIFSILMYAIAEMYIRPKNLRRILRICVGIAVIQLPVILIQQRIYDILPERFIRSVSLLDFDFGTFNYKADAPMTFFVALIIAFLLFRDQRNQVIRRKWPVVIWLTLTILVANAEIMKIVVALIWAIFIIRYFSIKMLIYASLALLALFLILTASGLLDETWADLSHSIAVNSPFNDNKREAFLAGDYGRGAAVGYYLTTDILFFGDGPSKYYDVLTSTYLRGNMGHAFTFYSEVGLIGWLLSMLIFYLIAFQKGSWRRNPRTGRVQMPWFSLIIFVVLNVLSFTTQVMNDVSVMLIYLILAKANAMWPEFIEQETKLVADE
jgi:hypothetical protein